MELKTVNKSITTTKKVYEKKNEHPIDCEFTLPDYCPDVERILKCSITPRVSNLSILSDTAQIDINAEICVLYVTKEDKLFGYEMPVSLSKSVNVGAIDKETIKKYFAKTEYVNCRAVNNRKIDVHGSVSVYLKLLVNEDKDYISSVSDESVVLKRQKMKLLEPSGFACKQVNIADDISISSSSGGISNIIRYDVNAVVDECKTISGKAVVKLTVCYEILYLSSDMRYETVKHTVPVNQVIDVDGCDESSVCRVECDVCSVSLKPVTDSEGEMRTINSLSKVNVSVFACSLCDVDMVTDGYSIKYESGLEKDMINCEQLAGEVHENIIVSNNIEVSSQISAIIDFRCVPLRFSCKNEGDNVFISGDIAVCVSLEDEDGSCKYYEKNVSYNERISARDCDDNCRFDFDLSAVNCSYNIVSGNSIDFKCEIHISGLVIKPCSINAVTAMQIDEDKEKSCDDIPSLVVYYGIKGESIWDIALKYNTSADIICEANGISGEALEDDKMLLIPCM